MRREEQVKLLKEEYKAEYVLNSSDENFFDELKELAKKLRATTCIDCVGGDFPGKLMDQLPPKSFMCLYGCLSKKPFTDFDPLLMLGRGQTIQSFVLGDFIKK